MLSIFARTSGCRRATEVVRTENDPEASVAFGCCIEKSEIARAQKLFVLCNFFDIIYGQQALRAPGDKKG
eukprot:6682349-Pyramimonas_sp.AAC.1